MIPIVCEVSGGYDSALATLMVVEAKSWAFPIFFDYGQQYERQERRAALYVVEQVKRFGKCADLRIASVSIETGPPFGSVADYVPIRNLIFGAMSANYAQALGSASVAVGSKTVQFREGDPYCFRDCTSDFYAKMGELVSLASEPGVDPLKFVQPLVSALVPLSKRDVLLLLHRKDFDLRRMWSCYSDTPEPCRTCYHCKVMAECVSAGPGLEAYAGVWG